MNPSELARALYVGILAREPGEQETANWSRALGSESQLIDAIKIFLESDERRRMEGGRQAPQSQVALFQQPGHFYSPLFHGPDDERFYRDPDEAPLTGLDTGLNLSPERYEEVWRRMVPYLKEFDFPNDKSDGGPRYYRANPAYGAMDGIVLYGMLRTLRPRRLIEVGSGFSTALVMDTMDRFPDWDVSVTLIEPYPQLVRTLLGDSAWKTRIIDQPIQAVDVSVFQELEAGDILFIDSSHVSKTGSDVNDELFRVLPSLAPGVIIHFHDIFYPFDYVRMWTVEQKRSWNEAYILRAFLMGNAAYRVKFFTDHFQRLQGDAFYDAYPMLRGKRGASLWLEKVSEDVRV